MSETMAETSRLPANRRRPVWMLGLAMVLAGAGLGYYAMVSGAVPTSLLSTSDGSEMPAASDAAYVELAPITVSLLREQNVQHLRFRAELEVDPAAQADVAHLAPRIMDVLNSYLGALELDDFRDPVALARLRGQILRRVQIVAGKDRVRDVLIMELVLN